ncbi:hypothetical protein L596_003262 [Steinernema carpocapsae]|uniref:Uncharacterized protein n=1 Tax=Steinernema carpocapsae TaxID=34508 RepID=A0A4U8UUX2_STECR|nr:hypothetical protein L596_003262 [Steinernema carpocapsae]
MFGFGFSGFRCPKVSGSGSGNKLYVTLSGNPKVSGSGRPPTANARVSPFKVVAGSYHDALANGSQSVLPRCAFAGRIQLAKALQWFEAQPEAMLTRGLRMMARSLMARMAKNGASKVFISDINFHFRQAK